MGDSGMFCFHVVFPNKWVFVIMTLIKAPTLASQNVDAMAIKFSAFEMKAFPKTCWFFETTLPSVTCGNPFT